MAGLPSLPSMEQAKADTVDAVVHDTNGTPLGPAKLTEGEIVFSIPAIIAIGKGDYHKGKQILTQTQERLRIAGEALMSTMADQQQ